MRLISFGDSDKKGKRFKIVIEDNNGARKTFHFGSITGQTFIDHRDKTKRANYIARHSVNENWNEVNPGSLSRYILWGNSTILYKNLEDFLEMFDIEYFHE